MIAGYGPIFKSSGLKIDALLPIAIQDGFVPQNATENDLYSLIQQAFSGKRTEALYKEQGQEDLEKKYTERQAQEEPAYEERAGQSDAEWYGMSEDEYVNMMAKEVAQSEDFDALEEAVGEMRDTPSSNISERAAMELLGFTEEEIQNEERKAAAKAGEAAPAEKAKGAEPSEAAPALELQTQTADELKAKQAEVDRLNKENERLNKQAEAKAKADAEREEFVLTGSDRAADIAAAQGQQDIFGAMEEPPAPKEAPSDMAYHAGNLNYGRDTTLGRMMGGRSTGHFGTGVYFVGDKSLISGREGRPIQAVDLSEYKLAKPGSSYSAKKLHDALKAVNRMQEVDSVDSADGEQAAETLHDVLGNSVASIKKAMTEAVAEAVDLRPTYAFENDYIDSASTRLMKKLGYEGVDTRGLEGLDNTEFGTVVYAEKIEQDKKQPVEAKEEGVKVVPFEADAAVVGDLLKETKPEDNPFDVRYNALMHSTSEVAKPKPTEFLTPEEAQAKVDEWKAEAARQGKTNKNSGRTILSLFDASGEWSKPWRDAGYDVLTFDIQTGEDINDFSAQFMMDEGLADADIWGILAAPPCTDFASSGAQYWAKKDAKGQTEASNELVRQVMRTVEFLQPKIWALENPVGRIAKLNNLPPAQLTFDPNVYGDPYTKKTLLWGNFDNNLPTAPVEPTEGSRIVKLSGKDKYARSLTPEGFAYAFFMANNAESMTPAERLARTYYGVDPKAFDGATEADEKAIKDTEFEDRYYDGDLEDAAGIAQDVIGNQPAQEKPEEFTPLKGEDGKPVVVYRGSIGEDQDTFTPTNFFGSGFFGKGINLTSSPEDASKYASTDVEVNIDLPGRASVMADALGIDYNEAKAELTKGGGKVYPLLVSLSNPLVVGKQKLNVPENVLRLALAESNFKGSDVDVDRFVRQFNRAEDGVAQFNVVVNNKASTIYRQIASLQNKDGLIIEPEVAPKGKGATHYLVFDKDQVKSVFEVASEVVGPAEKPAAPQLTREPITIEGQFTEVGEEQQRALITDQTTKLSDAQTATLEKFYGFARDTEEFANAVREDVINFITKGATYVNGKIRAIIKSMANGVLSVAVVFNPQFVSMPYTIAVPQYETRTERVMQEVPATVREQMSDDAKRAYSTIYPAIKAELQANDKFFIVADKQTANTFVFNPDGSSFMQSKTLFGAGIGDFVKGNNNIVSNRITPAGLFDLGLRDAKRSADEAHTAGEYDFGKVFVLDKSQKGANGFYSTTIMHSVWTKEADAKQRLAALQKPGAEDSRYSFGCINVDKQTYGKLVTNNLAQMDGAKIFIVPENGKDVMSFVNGEATYSEDIIRQRAEPVTKETKVEVQRAAETPEAERNVVGREEEGPVFNSIEPETAGWSPSRIDQLISEFGYTDGRTFGMAGYVNPADFVKATTPTLEAAEMLSKEAGELDAEAIRAERQTPFLFWDIDKGAIIDHEGRHRMAALARAGVTRAPVVLVVRDRYGSKKPDHYKPEYSKFLSGQGFQEGKGQGLSVKDLVPLSYEYKEQLGQDFGKAGFLYSLNSEKLFTSSVEEEKKRSPSFKRKVAKLNKDHQNGKITTGQMINEIDWALKQSEDARLSKGIPQKKRGYLELVNRLSEAAKNGDISKESFDLATWFMRNNESLVDDLGVSIRGKGDAGVGGQYVKFSRVMRLIKGGGSNLTVVHEILHHLERMMPVNVQQAIRKAWSKQLLSAQKKAKVPAEQLYFKLLIDGHYGKDNIDFIDVPEGEMSKVFMKALAELDFNHPGSKSSFELAEILLKSSLVPIENYQYFNPSEFWAVNGSEIVKGRFDAVQGGVLARLKNWLKELAQKIKGFVGMNSNASIIKALDSLSKADGTFVTQDMLSEGDYKSVRRNFEGNEAPAASWESPEESKMDTFIYKLQDKLIDTKRVIENIKKASGDVADNWDAYLKEELFHGRAAKRTQDFLNREMLPILEEMKAKGVTLAQFEEYLHMRHAEERNELVAKRNPKMPDQGSGVTTAQAVKYLANLTPEQNKTFQSLAGKFDKIIDNTQKLLVKSGIETQETIDAWNQAYEHYVPLMRDDLDFKHHGTGLGSGYSTKGATSKSAVGSTKKVIDIFANVALQRERAIVRAEKARVGRALYGLAIKNPNPSFWLPINPDAIKNKEKLVQELIDLGLSPEDAQNIIQEPKVASIDKKTGLVKYQVNPLMRNSDNVFPVRINGEDRYIFFNTSDERAVRMVEALKNLDAEQMGLFMGIMGNATRWLSSVNTQFNPVFGAWNFARDVQGAAFNLTTTPIAGHEKDVLKGVFPALRGIYTDLRENRKKNTGESEWAKLFEQYQLAGGQTGYRDQFNKAKEKANIVQRELSKLDRGNVSKAAHALFNWLSDYNDAMENAVRLSAFKVALDQGLSEERAASIAKNLTVNFNRKGASTPSLQNLFAFFNAAVQGTARLSQTLAGPSGRKIMAGGIAIGVAQALALAMAGYDDDDPPEFLKNKNLILPIPGGNYLIVPMPLGLNVFPGVGRLATEYVLGQAGLITGAKGAGDKLMSMGSLILDAFNPLGSGSLLQMVTPTVVDPWFAIAANRDAFGRPISKEDRANAPTPGYTRSRDTASWFSKQVAEFLNYVSSPSGTKYTKGAISPTADQIDYLIGQYTGGTGREFMKAAQYATAVVTGETSELPSYKVPIIGKLYGETESPAAVSAKFYENVIKLAEHENEIKMRIKNKDDIREYRAEHPETRFMARANNLENQITAINWQKKALQER
jgi:site-specific DNA-cytosine methylase